MENKVITLQINFTRKSLLILIGTLLLAAGLVVAGVALAQTPEEPEADAPVEPAAYDDTLYPKLPPQMNYQGVLKDDEGNPIDGTHDLTLTLYQWRRIGLDASWHEVYSETQTVAVNDGLFNVVIGASNPLDPGDFDGLYNLMTAFRGGSLELGVKVDGGPELTPRVKLLPVPYAFRAEYVNRFPRPHYDSGWTTVASGYRTFNHDLGGSLADYVVDLTCRDTASPPTTWGINQVFNGGEYYYNSVIDEPLQYGAHWSNLTTSSVEVLRHGDDTMCDQVRVRIWRMD